MKPAICFVCSIFSSATGIMILMGDIKPYGVWMMVAQGAWGLALIVESFLVIEKDMSTARLEQVEKSLHLALCIIENDSGPPHSEKFSETRRKWVREIELESGIDRSNL